jgi:hypothetical protein
MKTETVIGFKNEEVKTINKICDFVTESLGHCFCTNINAKKDPVKNLSSEDVNELYNFVLVLKKEINKE